MHEWVQDMWMSLCNVDVWMCDAGRALLEMEERTLEKQPKTKVKARSDALQC